MLAVIGLMVPRPTLAQTALPRFEVASIKPSGPSATRPGRLGAVQVVTRSDRLTARGAYLKELIQTAYGVEDYQVSGEPAWIGSALFDVEAKSMDAANRERLLLMLRALLAERFKLTVHRETKQLAIYALTVAKNGPKFRALTESEANCWGALCAASPSRTNVMRWRDLPSMAIFLTRLGSDRPVIDKTGLVGNFALEADMTPILEVNDQAAPTNETMFEGLVSTVEDRLGLRLVQTKAPVEVVVIDHVERPSGN
jgi:uncharacterized protein (TIGR03435 family)